MADEFRIHNTAVPRYVDGIGSANRKKTVERVRPRRHVGIGIDCRVAGFLDAATSLHPGLNIEVFGDFVTAFGGSV